MTLSASPATLTAIKRFCRHAAGPEPSLDPEETLQLHGIIESRPGTGRGMA